MANANETVREVCAEIRIQKYQTALTDRDVVALRDRILAAHERDMAAKDAEVAKHERCYHALEVHCKKLEEEYLRATNALKPVLECRIERIDGVDSPDGEFMTSSEYGVCDADGNEVDNHSIASSLNAVREAQRIVVAWDDKNYFWDDANNRVAKKCMEAKE